MSTEYVAARRREDNTRDYGASEMVTPDRDHDGGVGAGTADSAYEVAADRAADEVLRRLADGGHSSERSRASGRVPSNPMALGSAGGAASTDTTQRIQRSRAGGGPLPAGLRTRMEGAFGADFGSVRLHSGGAASRLNDDVGARAFTVGKDIFLGATMPALDTREGQHTLAHELTHTLQPSGPVLRRDRGTRKKGGRRSAEGGQSVPPDKTTTTEEVLTPLQKFKQSIASSDKNTRLHNIPSTGMGRFDAKYLPDKGRLIVTVRPYINFEGPWKDGEKQSFIKKIKAQTRSAWSGQYSFYCDKPGFEDLVANVTVRCVPMTQPTDAAHVHINLKHKTLQKPQTGIGREQNVDDPTDKARNVGNFSQLDAPVRAHDNLGTRHSLAAHDVIRASNFIEGSFKRVKTASNNTPYAQARVKVGSKYALDSDDARAITDLGGMLKKAREVGGTPLPLVLRYHQAGRGNHGLKRAEAVKKALVAAGVTTPIKVVAIASEKKALEAEKESKKSTGGKQYVQEQIDDLFTDGYDEHDVELGPDHKWAQTFVDTDPYSILAHEFGHMLGNPDEYFGYGPQFMAQKRSELQKKMDPESVGEIKNLRQADNSTENLQKRHEIQDNFGKLVLSAGQELPRMTTQGTTATTSIMNAGALVLPAHYATLWEALGRITSQASPALTKDDWKWTP